MKYQPLSLLKVRYYQTPCLERAKLLLDAYKPSNKLSAARMVKTIKIAKVMAIELEPEDLIFRT